MKNRNYILNIIEIVLCLAKQSVSFRGHREDSNSCNQGTKCILQYKNYKQLVT
jgi:hypothetical protein